MKWWFADDSHVLWSNRVHVYPEDMV